MNNEFVNDKEFARSVKKAAPYALVLSFLATGVSGVSAVELEEILVTAQKRAQSVQDVGVTISSLSGEDIEELGFDEPRDLMFQTPGLTVSYNQGGTLPNFSLRGVGINDFAPNNSSPVAVHLDEVYFAYSSFLNFGLFDLERTEVLKGPQGTLFGRNTTGGAVNFFSAKPSEEFDAGVSVSYGNYEALRTDFHIGGKISDNANGRLSGFYRTQGEGAWFNRTLNRDVGEIDRLWGLRGQLEYNPNDDLTILFNVHGGAEKSEQGQYNILPALDANTPFDADGNAVGCPAYLNGTLQGGEPDCIDLVGNREPDSDPFTNSAGVPGTQAFDSFGFNVKVGWDLGFAQLDAITAYDELNRFTTEDVDGFPEVVDDLVYDNDVEQISQEIRLSGDSDNHRWLVGVLISQDEINTSRFDFLGFDFPGFLGGQNVEYKQESFSAALFAHTEWQLSDNLNLIAGIRYTKEDREFNGFSDFTVPPANFQPGDDGLPDGGPIFLAKDEELNFSDVSGKLGFEYVQNDNVLWYGSISKGFKSGGFNGNFPVDLDGFESFTEEELIAYEVGVKATLAGGAATWNTSVYHYDYSDVILQSSETLLRGDETSFTAFRFNNNSDADVDGLETELRWLATEGLDIRLGASYVDSELINDDPGAGVSGSELRYTPKFSANWLVRYERPVGNNLIGVLNVNGTHKGDSFGEVPNSPISKIDSYTLWNARLSLSKPDSSWDVALWGENLTDEVYELFVLDILGLGDTLYTTNVPRTYGIELSYKW